LAQARRIFYQKPGSKLKRDQSWILSLIRKTGYRWQNLPPVSTTLAKMVEKFAPGVVDTGSNFAAGVVDTSGKFATGVVGGKLIHETNQKQKIS
jgi:hypothetical protein